jgi:hypothetical protein
VSKPEAFVFLFKDEKDLLAPNFKSIVAGTHAMHGPELTVLFRNFQPAILSGKPS